MGKTIILTNRVKGLFSSHLICIKLSFTISECKPKKKKKQSGTGKTSLKLFTCSLCEFTSTKSEYFEHRRKVHGFGKKHFPCDKCDYVSNALSGLKVHVKAIHEGIKFLCDECEKVFSNDAGLRKHKRAVHSNIPYLCQQCDFRCFRSEILKDHLDSVHKGIRYYCDQCPFAAKTKGNLNVHIGIKHSKLDSNNESAFIGKKINKVQCHLCTYMAPKYLLKDHITSKHEGLKYSCDQCNRKFGLKYNLNNHMKTHDPEFQNKPKIVFQCDQCDIVFDRRDNLLRHHKRRKGSTEIFVCQLCSEKFCLEWKLRRHTNLKHAKQEEKCDQCEKAFYSKQSLNRHKKCTHSM